MHCLAAVEKVLHGNESTALRAARAVTCGNESGEDKLVMMVERQQVLRSCSVRQAHEEDHLHSSDAHQLRQADTHQLRQAPSFHSQK